jgi:hypothetical protein
VVAVDENPKLLACSVTPTPRSGTLVTLYVRAHAAELAKRCTGPQQNGWPRASPSTPMRCRGHSFSRGRKGPGFLGVAWRNDKAGISGRIWPFAKSTRRVAPSGFPHQNIFTSPGWLTLAAARPSASMPWSWKIDFARYLYCAAIKLREPPIAIRPANLAREPNVCSTRMASFHFAIRSDRENEPTLS